MRKKEGDPSGWFTIHPMITPDDRGEILAVLFNRQNDIPVMAGIYARRKAHPWWPFRRFLFTAFVRTGPVGPFQAIGQVDSATDAVAMVADYFRSHDIERIVRSESIPLIYL